MVIHWRFDNFEINIENNNSIDMKILVHFRQLNIKKNEQSKLKEKKTIKVVPKPFRRVYSMLLTMPCVIFLSHYKVKFPYDAFNVYEIHYHQQVVRDRKVDIWGVCHEFWDWSIR